MSSSNAKLQPLVFASYEELKTKGCEMDKGISYELKRKDVPKIFKHFVDIEREARMRQQVGDQEQAFILYSRGMDIYRLISDKMTDVFKRSQDGRKFYKITEELMLNYEQLALTLKERFKQNSTKQMEELVKPRDDIFLDGLYAKPVAIVHFVEQGKAALVLDYRADQAKSLEFKGTKGSMKVVHIDRDHIMPGSLIHSLTKALDISVRPIMEKLSQFDAVILVGDAHDITKEKGTKTLILYEALTTYNINNKLKRAPIIMERGFESWLNAYPFYVNVNEQSDVPKFEKSFDDMFSCWIEESRKANQIKCNYPVLGDFGVASLRPETSNTANIRFHQTNDAAKTTTALYPSNALKHRTASASTSSTRNNCNFPSSKETTEDKNKRISIVTSKIPAIDRSKKPSDRSSSLSTDKSDASWAPTQPISHGYYNKENRPPPLPSNVPKKRSAPPPQVLGGARVAHLSGEPSPPADASTTTAQPNANARPLTPDRSTKNSLLIKQQQNYETYFQNSYMMAIDRIIEESTAKRNKTKPGHTGLLNMGNTCFMNATLQALFHTPGFVQLFKERNVAKYININNSLGTRGIISGCFSALLDLAWSGDYAAIRPQFFLQIFAQRVNSALADRQQHDAQEFQIYLLDALHEDSNRVSKRRPFEQNYDCTNLTASAKDFFERSNYFSSSPVNDIFNLTTISTLQCKTCNATSVRFEGLNQISVELTNLGKPLKLRDCLNAHFSTTNLDSLWDCPQCKTKHQASRNTKLWTFPKVLIIHMKRFSFNAGQFVKNETEMSFDVNDLELTPYVHQKASFCKASYSLYAVTNHSGTLNSGHYTSYVKNLASEEREWLYFDDERCTRLSSHPSSSSKQAFLLYYALNANSGSDAGKVLI